MSPRRVAKALAGTGVLALVVIAVIAVWTIKRQARDRIIKQALDLVPGSLLHARNFHWTQMKGDQKQWELVAREASYSDDKSSLKLTGTELSMVLDGGKTLRLRAPAARLAMSGNHVTQARLSGGLELDYGDVVLNTAEATFEPDRDQLEAPGLVKIHAEGLDVSGIGLEAHPRQRLFTLQHQVSSTFKARPGRVPAQAN